jgi:mono/diheme cytochrome c family protein
MRPGVLVFAFVLAAPFADAAEPAAQDHGAKVFQRCAACHLASGQGVPGAFPALAGRLATAAENDSGRDYLVMTVASGVMGEIDVDGKKIRGFMPAQAGLSDADIAAVLNYSVALKPATGAAATAAAPKPFDAAEVASIRAKHKGANPNAVHALRAAAFAPPATTEAK